MFHIPYDFILTVFVTSVPCFLGMYDTTLTEVFPCFFLGCKANARVILAKTGHGPQSSKIVVLFYVLFVLYRSMYCLCVNVYCHRVTTQLQLTNISYHIILNSLSRFPLILLPVILNVFIFLLLTLLLQFPFTSLSFLLSSPLLVLLALLHIIILLLFHFLLLLHQFLPPGTAPP